MSDSFCEINWNESKYKTAPGISYSCACCLSLSVAWELFYLLFVSVSNVAVFSVSVTLHDSLCQYQYCLRFDYVCLILQNTSLLPDKCLFNTTWYGFLTKRTTTIEQLKNLYSSSSMSSLSVSVSWYKLSPKLYLHVAGQKLLSLPLLLFCGSLDSVPSDREGNFGTNRISIACTTVQ